MRASIQRPRFAPLAPRRRARRYPSISRHDSQSTPPRGRGGLRKWRDQDRQASPGRRPAQCKAGAAPSRATWPAAKQQAGRPKFTLSNLRPPRGSRIKKVRVGRGIGTKLGKTAGAGNKGQKSRRGYSRRRGFEGGQMPLHRRMPKRGFHNPFWREYSVINLADLNVFPAGETVTPDLLRAHGFIRRPGSTRSKFWATAI